MDLRVIAIAVAVAVGEIWFSFLLFSVFKYGNRVSFSMQSESFLLLFLLFYSYKDMSFSERGVMLGDSLDTTSWAHLALPLVAWYLSGFYIYRPYFLHRSVVLLSYPYTHINISDLYRS